MVNIVEEQKKRIRYMYSFMFRRYKANTLSDGGIVKDDSITRDYLKMAQNNRMDKSIRFGWIGEAGSKIESGKVSKLYSFDFNNYQNNATQITPGLCPYLTGNIAPNERIALKNPNGGGNFMTHPAISFGAWDSWSVTTVLNWNGSHTETQLIVGGATSIIGLRGITGLNIFLRNNENITYHSGADIRYLVGKLTTLTLSYANRELKVYVNSVLRSTVSCGGTYVLSQILNNSIQSAKITIKSHIIRSQALTQAQVTAEYNYLRSVYPEIENVVIGTQTWATSNCEMAATPMGNVIAEMQANGNVEKITNIDDREFSSDTGWWLKSGEITIANGICNIKTTTGTISSIEKATLLTNGKWYRLKYDVIANRNGGLQIFNGSSVQSISSTVENNKLFYFYAGGAYFNIARTGSVVDIDIDNVSIQEIGWSGSQELYDGIYAQTAGTVEQKTYAAVKAAAMWCHYNNDVALGAVYGKLYNWFAVKLLQMDIDYYNAANPTTPWGWRVPAQADFQTLSTYLGGDDVSGGKLKLAGTTYWESPNTGATNESGFTAIPSALSFESGGGFIDTNKTFNLHSITEISGNISRLVLRINTSVTERTTHPKIRGCSLRLIKN